VPVCKWAHPARASNGNIRKEITTFLIKLIYGTRIM